MLPCICADTSSPGTVEPSALTTTPCSPSVVTSTVSRPDCASETTPTPYSRRIAVAVAGTPPAAHPFTRPRHHLGAPACQRLFLVVIALLGRHSASSRQIEVDPDLSGSRLIEPPVAPSIPAGPVAETRQADVTSPQHFPALDDIDVVVSAIGIRKGDGPGAPVAGARVPAARGVPTVWLGALGSGLSTGAGGALYQAIMRMAVGRELAEKAEADQIALRPAPLWCTPRISATVPSALDAASYCSPSIDALCCRLGSPAPPWPR